MRKTFMRAFKRASALVVLAGCQPRRPGAPGLGRLGWTLRTVHVAQNEVMGVDGKWHTTNHATVWRWRGAMQNDFAARMDWTVKPYAAANHPPVPALAHAASITARPEERVELDAGGSSDPDGDARSYAWSRYCEAGTLVASSSRSGQPLEIVGADQKKAWFTVPATRVLPPGLGTLHIILAVTDHGTPRLSAGSASAPLNAARQRWLNYIQGNDGNAKMAELPRYDEALPCSTATCTTRCPASPRMRPCPRIRA